MKNTQEISKMFIFLDKTKQQHYKSKEGNGYFHKDKNDLIVVYANCMSQIDGHVGNMINVKTSC